MSGRQAGLPYSGHHVFKVGEAEAEEDRGDQGVEAECRTVLHEGEATEEDAVYQ